MRAAAKKRIRTVFSRAHAIHHRGASVYIVIEYLGRYHWWESERNKGWPPSRKQIVSHTYPYTGKCTIAKDSRHNTIRAHASTAISKGREGHMEEGDARFHGFRQ